jgi:hypothetical protein
VRLIVGDVPIRPSNMNPLSATDQKLIYSNQISIPFGPSRCLLERLGSDVTISDRDSGAGSSRSAIEWPKMNSIFFFNLVFKSRKTLLVFFTMNLSQLFLATHVDLRQIQLRR